MKEQTMLDVQALRLEFRTLTQRLVTAYTEQKDARLNLRSAKENIESAETILVYEESRNPSSDLKAGKNAEERKLALDYFLINARNGKLKSFKLAVIAAEQIVADCDTEAKNIEAKIAAIKADLNGCIAILGVLSA